MLIEDCVRTPPLAAVRSWSLAIYPEVLTYSRGGVSVLVQEVQEEAISYIISSRGENITQGGRCVVGEFYIRVPIFFEFYAKHTTSYSWKE